VSISADVPQFGHAGRNPSHSDPLDLDHAKSRVGVSVYIQEQAERPNGKVPFLLGESAKHGDGGSIGLDHWTQSSPSVIPTLLRPGCLVPVLQYGGFRPAKPRSQSSKSTAPRCSRSLLAISPQTAANGRKSVRQNKLGFPILSDVKGNISSAFGPR
jgi:hypothetical protein